MMYEISKYSFKKAKDLNVVIKPSKKKNKKIDVFSKEGDFIVSIGAVGYKDFPTYIKTKGLTYAMERRRLYKIRHKNNTGLSGYYASNLLW